MARQIFMRYPGGVAKALTLSYDDGVEQDRRMVEILNAHGLKCTFNLNSGLYSPEGKVFEAGRVHRRMTKNAVTATFAESGHEVAVHALNHPHLEVMTPAHITYEVMQDRVNLEQQFGRIVRGMAYPYGTFSDEVVECLKACGILYARTTVSTERFNLPTDWLRMPATCHHNSPRLMQFAQQFADLKVGDMPRLFYLWGHTYEFEGNNNWNVIEEFAEFIGGREDIWYATNMEVYQCVQDYERLEWSADEKRVFNPNARTVWFTYDGETVELPAGESRTFA